MVVRVLVGDLFESDAQTLVNTVNCVGVMGRGIALQFKKRFPAMFRDYEQRCRAQEVTLGRPYLYSTLFPPSILNFPTKDHWRSVARLSDITAGLDHLEAHYQEWGIQSLAVPPLGCGEGQLDWSTVGPELYRRLNRLEIPVELYAPHGTPASRLAETFLSGTETLESWPRRRLSSGLIGFAVIVQRLGASGRGPTAGRVVLHEIAFLATVAGIPMGLTFERGSYGPFASGLKRQIAKLVNNGVLVERRRGSAIVVEAGPTLVDAQAALDALAPPWEPAITNVVETIEGQSTRELELVASALLLFQDLAPDDVTARKSHVIEELVRLKAGRRPVVDHSEAERAVRRLDDHGWLRESVTPSARA
jgi:O-acetyl-ADP-ribose deacetylase (regulator of RNase III)/uncharacterized protein YwgA